MNVAEDTLLAGAALYGVDPRSLKSLGGSDGAVYSCRRGSRACTIKFVPMPPEKLTAYEEKLAFILYLDEHGVPLAVPQQAESGRRFEILPGEGGPYAVSLTHRAGGRNPSPRNLYDWNERLFACWGQAMGQMHALARAYPRWRKPAPGEDDPPSQLGDWQSEHEFFAGWCQEPKIVAQWRRLFEPLAALPRKRDGFGLIHNDLHMGNFLYDPDARGGSPITIIDFDVCGYHWFITDIAIPVYHGMIFGQHKSLAQRETFARQFLQHFMRGYCQENALDPAWLDQLPLFLRYREILLYIALSNEWPAGGRNRWQAQFLAEKRARILRGEPVIERL
jgi:Ser/Thr protein kinase RdoA (MazF antagonist)